MFERIQASLFEMKNELLKNAAIRKLLAYDSNNALELAAPEPAEVRDFIVMAPLYDITTDYKKNAIIHLEFDSGDYEDNIVDGVIRVNIVMNKEKWELVGNKIRPLVLVDEIVKMLDGKKFSMSNTLEFTRIVPLIINKNVTGYALLFAMLDGVAETADI